MNIFELFEESILVLKTNKLRTGLSVLGIVIGIGSVITLMTIGQASQKSITDRIQSLGANLLTISPGSDTRSFLRNTSNGGTSLTNDDAKAISESNRINTIDKVAGVYSSNVQATFMGNNDSVQVTGTTLEYFDLRNIELLEGSFFTEYDDLIQNKVAVVNQSTINNLVQDQSDYLGKSIKINGNNFTIIGVTKDGSSFGRTMNEVYVPLSTAQNILFGVDYLSSIYVGAKSSDLMEQAKNQLGFLLLERHGFAMPSQADFTISSQADILETVSSVTQTFTLLLTGIAAISLVVGGIGIMNIMLVTITERTREIGIRKALGAKRKIIILQFLIESIILTIFGGILGVLIGVIVSYFVTTKIMNLAFLISVESIIISVIVSCIIGIIFGIYPAFKASKLQPIEALRYE